jgi:amino acid transporter
LLATIGILFTAQCVNEFTTRSSSPGSLYTFVREGFGHRAGVITGWGLMFAYVVCTSCCIVEFALYATSLCKDLLGWAINSQAMIVAGSVLSGYIAYKNIKMSTRLMLSLELLSVSLILSIIAMSISKHGWALDPHQVQLSGVHFENVRMGLVMAIFGFAAFETSASLGVEAVSPLQTIPKAVMRSVIFSGAFFVICAYALVMAFHGNPQSLDKCSTPLLTVCGAIGLPGLGHVVDAGIMVSFFAAALANLNAAARAVYQMSQDGVLHEFFGKTHHINFTPHTAVISCVSASLAIAVILAGCGFSLLDVVGWLGTLATFGFIYGYMATSVAAGKMLKRAGELNFLKISIVVISLVVLVSSLIGSLYPVPAFPYNLLPFIFVGYMGFGAIWCFFKVVPPVVAKTENSSELAAVDLSNG